MLITLLNKQVFCKTERKKILAPISHNVKWQLLASEQIIKNIAFGPQISD